MVLREWLGPGKAVADQASSSANVWLEMLTAVCCLFAAGLEDGYLRKMAGRVDGTDLLGSFEWCVVELFCMMHKRGRLELKKKKK